MASGGASSVTNTMIDYVYYFFTCRHCAENFRNKVHNLGFLPSNNRDSILWLWQIHNMANVKLQGKFLHLFEVFRKLLSSKSSV